MAATIPTAARSAMDLPTRRTGALDHSTQVPSSPHTRMQTQLVRLLPSTQALPNRVVSGNAQTATKARAAEVVARARPQATHTPNNQAAGPRLPSPHPLPRRTAPRPVFISVPVRPHLALLPDPPHPLPRRRHLPLLLTSTCENRPHCLRARSRRQRNACHGTIAIWPRCLSPRVKAGAEVSKGDCGGRSLSTPTRPCTRTTKRTPRGMPLPDRASPV